MYRVITIDKRGAHKSLPNFFRFIKNLKKNNYDIVYSPHRSLRSGIIALSMSLTESFSFENSALKFAFRNVVKYDYSAHEVRRNLEFIGSDYPGNTWRIIPEIVIPEESINKVKKILNENNINKFIAVAPGSVWETKRYPVDYYKQIVKFFSDSNFQIVLIGGTSDKTLCDEIKKDFNTNVTTVAGKLSFIDSIQLLKHSLLLICNDSAPTHLCVCANIPVLTIYCSTVPYFGFYPYNSKSDFISYDKLNCKPCGIHGHSSCPIDTFECAWLLTPDKIISKARKLLSDANI